MSTNLSTGRGMSDTMYSRWRSHRYIAQATEASNSDHRPTGRVFVSRGYMQRFIDYRSDQVQESGVLWRGIWDEKYTWGGMPGQITGRDPSLNGHPRDTAFRGSIELPHVNTINIRNSVDQNGIGTATIVINNIHREETVGGEGFVYNILQEGFYSPHFNGDGDFDVHDVDLFLGSGPRPGMTTNADGKVITGLMLPNRKIEIFQGYGDEVQRTFVGLIDSISIEARSGKMTIECSDFGRVLSETTYNQFSCPPGRYPVAFCDWKYVREIPRTRWVKKFHIMKTATPVIDITHIAGRLYGWAGFHSWNRVHAGRIGKSGAGKMQVGDERRAIRSVFHGDNFEKGSYFIDGINQIKTLLGYIQYITPDFDTTMPGSERFTDPDVYDDEYSKHAIGIPNFVPPNIWAESRRNSTSVEQFIDNEILLDGGLVYDHAVLRKQIYVTGTGHKTRAGSQRVFGYHAPFELEAGLITPIYYNVHDELGIKMSELEIQIFMRRIIMNTLMSFNRGSFTVPGWPGACINKQVDILESKTGTWRRFYVNGFESEMELGPKASWKTSVEVVNLDNIYIKRIKRQLKALLKVNEDVTYDDMMFQQPKTRVTPGWVNRPARTS